MPWLLIYGSVAVTMLAVISLCCARHLRGDAFRLIAAAAAAALWPVMVIGLAQYAAIRALGNHLSRRSGPAPAPAPVAALAEPVTTPMELVDSLARFAQRIGATRHA